MPFHVHFSLRVLVDLVFIMDFFTELGIASNFASNIK